MVVAIRPPAPYGSGIWPQEQRDEQPRRRVGRLLALAAALGLWALLVFGARAAWGQVSGGWLATPTPWPTLDRIPMCQIPTPEAGPRYIRTRKVWTSFIGIVEGGYVENIDANDIDVSDDGTTWVHLFGPRCLDKPTPTAQQGAWFSGPLSTPTVVSDLDGFWECCNRVGGARCGECLIQHGFYPKDYQPLTPTVGAP